MGLNVGVNWISSRKTWSFRRHNWQMIYGVHMPRRRSLIHLVLLRKQMVETNQFAPINRLAHGWVFHLTAHTVQAFVALKEIPDSITESSLSRSEQKCFHSLSGTLFRFLRETFSPSCLMHYFLFKNNSKCISRTCLSAGLLKSLLTINLLRNIYLLASRVIDFPFYANNHMANGNYV